MLDPAFLIGTFPQIHGHRTYYLSGMEHKQLRQPVLYRSKACIAVQIDHAVFQLFPSWKFPAKDIQNFLCRNIVILNIVPKALIDHSQILKLVL